VGNKNRSVASTLMNSESSRSHSMVTLTIIMNNTEDGSCKTGKLNLVDLAGSEKISKTGAAGQTLEEAKNINKSLTTLGKVIVALTDRKATHIPYRESKLTRILTESLGGNSKTCLIITMSPHPFNESETLSTLRFGARARNIQNKAVQNKEYSVAELRKMLDDADLKIDSLNKHIVVLTSKIKEMGGDVPSDKELDAYALQMAAIEA
jgi:kinesin family protein 5